MLQLSRHSSARLVRALHGSRVFAPEVLSTTTRSPSIWRRDLASSAPHDTAPLARARSAACGDIVNSHTQCRRGIDLRVGGLRPTAWPSVTPSALQQRRGLASAGDRKGGGADKDDGMFDRLKKTFQEEIDRV